MSIEDSKKQAAVQAASYVKDGMLIGIGTGSTVFFLIEELIKRVKEGLKIQAVSSSVRSFDQGVKGGIDFADINQIETIDLTIDGADEIDPNFHMIKGGGGALLREKILATSSKSMIVIVDESKVVEKLGKHKLPLEIIPFGVQTIIKKVNHLGFMGQLRKTDTGDLYQTDNGNYIYDIAFEDLRSDILKDHQNLITIPGVVETGFFFDVAKKLIVGFEDGHIEERTL